MMQKLECLPLEEVVRACEHEAQAYRSQHSTTDLFRLELFRRAICQQDQAAWQEIYTLYASLVCSWIWRYARGTTWLDQEEAASLANVAFAKLARNLTASKFENFASIGAILGYFKLVVHSVVADERAFRDSLRDQRAETAGLLSLSYRGAEDLASIVASNEDARSLITSTLEKKNLELAMTQKANHSQRSTFPRSRSLSMSENHESPLVFLQLVKERRCTSCGGQARILIDLDTDFPQLDGQGRTQYFCLQCDAILPGERIIQRTVKQHLQEGSPLYHVLTLGQFTVERRTGKNWRPIAGLAAQPMDELALLIGLVSSPGRKLGREQATHMLWPELDVETAANRLDKAVYNLHRLFEPGRSRPATSNVLLTEHATLRLSDQSQLWVDADAFEARLRQARESLDPGQTEHLLEEAMLLYGGDYLPEEHVIPWVGARRESLHRSWTGLLLELADLRIAREDPSSATDILDRLLAVDPANEAAVQRLVILLAQSGRRAEAMCVYRRFAAVLRREYKIAPLPETRELLFKRSH